MGFSAVAPCRSSGCLPVFSQRMAIGSLSRLEGHFFAGTLFAMLNRRFFLGAGAAALSGLRPLKAVGFALEASRLLQEEGRYLPLLRELQAGLTQNPSLRDPLAQLLAMTGDEAGAFSGWQRPFPTGIDLAAAAMEEALEAILGAAKHRQIVILNEAHNISRCRAFAEALMTRLHAEGFTHFAAETFSSTARSGADAEITALNQGAPLTARTGWYVADPVYAEMIRAARALGYHFAAYEMRPDQLFAPEASPGQRIEVREDAEANNFIANILAREPKARVFVYCGYDHVLKAEMHNHELWFAARLKAKSGIDPLCIGQAWAAPPPVGQPEDPGLAALLDQFRPSTPVILRDHAGAPLIFSASRKALDFEVIHPRLNDVSGRPGWLAAAPGRKESRFKLNEIAPAGALLRAVPQAEAVLPGAVPADQYPALAEAREAVFFLKPGTYEIQIEEEDGKRELGPLTV